LLDPAHDLTPARSRLEGLTPAALARIVVELWRPDLANKPADLAPTWKRWMRLGMAWSVFAVVATVSSFLLSVYTIRL
jgi:hypothetical protein